MLTEQRYEMILNLLNEKKSITVTEVRELLHISESTARRDIAALHNAKRLTKVFGGAVALDNAYRPSEPTVAEKAEVNRKEKETVGKYAASLIEKDDFIYMDAGTTTGYMLDFISEESATYVTNAVEHARKLAARGFKVILIGGELKGSTEAVVGNQAMETLKKYHFTKGFFGTNGITKNAGFTTPDANEALVKKTALEQCQTGYILADFSKFGVVSSVTFAPFKGTEIITDRLPDGFKEGDALLIAKK